MFHGNRKTPQILEGLQIMTKSIHIVRMLFLFSFFIIFCNHTYADVGNSVRLALLDTPYNEIPLNLSLLSEYQKAYLAGIETAAHDAKKYGFTLIYT